MKREAGEPRSPSLIRWVAIGGAVVVPLVLAPFWAGALRELDILCSTSEPKVCADGLSYAIPGLGLVLSALVGGSLVVNAAGPNRVRSRLSFVLASVACLLPVLGLVAMGPRWESGDAISMSLVVAASAASGIYAYKNLPVSAFVSLLCYVGFAIMFVSGLPAAAIGISGLAVIALQRRSGGGLPESNGATATGHAS